MPKNIVAILRTAEEAELRYRATRLPGTGKERNLAA